MPRSPLRRPIAVASAFALGATVSLVGGTAATASLPGSGSVLTSSNGQTVIRFHGDPTRTSLSSSDTVTEAAWSPDGSQAVYIDQGGRVGKLRFNDGTARYPVTSPPDAGVLRHSPSWWADGSRVAWAEKASAAAPWHVAWQRSVGPLRQGWISPRDGKHYLNPDGGPGLRVVFQRQDDDGSGQPSGRSAVMLYDGARILGQVTLVDDNGSNPSISPDGSRVAFVRAGRIVVSDLAGENEVLVTPEGVQYDDPTWSPEGTTLAFSRVTSTGARPAYTALADGSAEPVVVPGLDGVPAYQPRRKDRVARLSGANRFDTAVAVSRSLWPAGGADAVVLSRSDTYADALSGSTLAAAKRGPLLLTPPTGLDARTKAEMQRVLMPGHGTVYLLGSPGALSTAVEVQVRALGYHVRRLAGPDRYSTSLAIAREIDPTPDVVLLATGMNYPDALAAGAAAGSYNASPDSPSSAVLLLTRDQVIPPATKAFLDALPQERLLYGIGLQGGTAAYSYDPVGPLVRGVWGASRYDTAYLTALEFFEGQRYTGIATGTDWPDALTGGALMGVLGGPLMLTPGTGTSLAEQATMLLNGSSGSVHTGLVFGSAAVVGPAQQTQLGTWLGGPLGSSSVNNPTDLEVPLNQ
ncbi:cell wall-binding repeat-containing protein [Plantactinospora soyae]|uniref:Dipeptidyl aminopeptidase/acylaminoacyl peptidase n=1 Tax=Plantactinospora soyae TaxID=1544732 RepID=A0A927M6N6_9ACTN|nr:cell wall-binding repeat-containing protein [Plantactinospora soyae]MBE1486398.1 dipeptidyl aminopeptidase/acylaminoacyl peptidase [Plantactinospora soyae]